MSVGDMELREENFWKPTRQLVWRVPQTPEIATVLTHTYTPLGKHAPKFTHNCTLIIVNK